MGELARKPGAPDFSKTPMELLTLQAGEGFSLFGHYGMPVACALSGVFSVGVWNKILKRPLWAGIHIYLLAGGIAYGGGVLWRNYAVASRSEDTAVLKHYVSLHPEDFPPFERRRVKDMFVPWHPIR